MYQNLKCMEGKEMSKLASMLIRKFKRFWNAFKWTVKEMLSSHIVIVLFLTQAVFREDHTQVLAIAILYIPLMSIAFQLMEIVNQIRYVKKEDKNTYYAAKRLSDIEIYGE